MLYKQEVNRFSRLEWLAKQVVEGFITGMHKSPFHGFSVEFAEHRLYNTGEPTRHIDWKLFGRTEKLFVKQFEEETNLRCRLVLDISPSMYYPSIKDFWKEENKLSFSVKAMAALVQLFRAQRDAFGLTIFSGDTTIETAARSSMLHQQLIYSYLEPFTKQFNEPQPGESHIHDALHRLAETIHKRSLVIMFTDMLETGGQFESVFSALQHLRHNRHEVILFHVADRKTEYAFSFDNMPYKFVDLESGEKMQLNPSEIRASYVSRMNNFLDVIRNRCAQYRIDLVEVDVARGFEPVLSEYLIRRSRLR